MRFINAFRLLIFFSAFTFAFTASAQVRTITELLPADSIVSVLKDRNVALDNPLTVKSVVEDGNQIRVKLSNNAKNLPLTRAQLQAAVDSVRKWAAKPTAVVKFYTSEVSLSDITLSDGPSVGTLPKGSPIRREDDGFSGALDGRNIALWPSHGRYFESSLNRWEWQRGRLFTTVEDLLSPSYVLPFLIPVLENAGAMVFTPRERDTTRVSVIVDNADDGFSSTRLFGKTVKKVAGFAHYETLKDKDNPFLMGDAYVYSQMNSEEDSVVFHGRTEVSGPQMLYISYPAITDGTTPLGGTELIVRHAGGVSRFRIDQSRGGGMWMPVGLLPFAEGHDWYVILRGDGSISADAVRIGGGMGTVERNGDVSGLPSWAEAARYYLQTDGFDYDKVLSLSKGGKEYTDDINARGEWVNALVSDKNIPIDLSFALHTDAGVTFSDSIIGTLAIVTTNKSGSISFPDGRSRSISRQLAGAVSKSVTDDIHRVWNANWTSRGISDKGYSESRRPDVPALLLELLSHQNVADLRLGLHPAFRRDVARSIYKGMLRFLCGPDAPVTPLPPSRLSISFTDSDSLRISWTPTVDTLESSAIANRFAVYDGSRLVAITAKTSVCVYQHRDGIIHNYRVVAIGPGGRSLPSESLPACLWQGGKKALLVEGMDRLSAPDMILSESWSGVLSQNDAGVPWPGDVYSVGEQFEFDPKKPWADDDAPGCGASYADREMISNQGGSTNEHKPSDVAVAMRMAGYSFVSQTKEAFDCDTIALTSNPYDFIRINLDRQKTTAYGDAGTRHQIYTKGFCRHVDNIIASGSRLLISGSFVGTDISSDSVSTWCSKSLGIKFRTSHASRSFSLRMMDKSSSHRWMRENCVSVPDKSHVWNPQADAIEPASTTAKTVARYTDSQMSAVVEYGSVTVVGF